MILSKPRKLWTIFSEGNRSITLSSKRIKGTVQAPVLVIPMTPEGVEDLRKAIAKQFAWKYNDGYGIAARVLEVLGLQKREPARPHLHPNSAANRIKDFERGIW